jgi:hypothetical protein
VATTSKAGCCLAATVALASSKDISVEDQRGFLGMTNLGSRSGTCSGIAEASWRHNHHLFFVVYYVKNASAIRSKNSATSWA